LGECRFRFGFGGLEHASDKWCALKHLRQSPEPASLKLIMVTNETEVGHLLAALEAGANEYVVKPFTEDILRDKLDMLGVLPTVKQLEA
jgi:DNA-binding response OmpR family regulator